MVDTAGFHRLATSVGNRNIALSLTSDKKGLLVSGNVIVRWIRSMKASNNREVSRLFIDALKTSYGDQIANQVIDETMLTAKLEGGKPLHTRKIMQALNLAEEIKQGFVKANLRVASSYQQPLFQGAGETPLRLKFDQTVTRVLGHTEDAEAVKAKLDMKEFSQKFEEKIEGVGKGGKRFVTSEKAGKIAESWALSQIGLIYRALLLERMDLVKEGSLGQQQWLKRNPDPATGLSIDLSGPRNIAQEINQGFTKEVTDPIYLKLGRFRTHSDANVTNAPSISLSSADLSTMAEKIVEKFTSERFAAAQAAQDLLPVNDAGAKERIVREVLHGNMPASMVPAFCKVYPRVSQSFFTLGKSPAPPPEELEKALAEMHDAVMEVMREGNLSFDTKDAVMRSFWQALLAGHDATQLNGVVDQLGQKESPLGCFTQGAHYFRYTFAQSDACQSKEKSGIYQSSIDTAGNYDFILNNLAQVFQDKAQVFQNKKSAPESLVGLPSLETLPDNAITMLRNLGIKIPAPSRLGKESSDSRLSNQTLENVQKNILNQGQQASKKIANGVTKEFAADLGRAVYRLQGEDLGTDSQEIINRLREFCTDESGNLNEAMLLGISKVAYQASFGSLMVILAPGNEHMAPFQSVPGKDGASTHNSRPEYDIDKNEKGEVTVRMKFSEPVQRLDGLDINTGESTNAQLKSDTSRFGMFMDISLDKENFEPTLNQANMNYAFYPESPVSESQ